MSKPKSYFTLKVIPFKNPSGEEVHRGTGQAGYKRVRKNFQTYAEAEAYLEEMRGKYAGMDQDNRRACMTTLPPLRLAESEYIYAALLERGRGKHYPRFSTSYIKHNKPVIGIKLEEAWENYAE